MRALVSFTAVLLSACADRPPATPNDIRPSDVLELAALPPGYQFGERLIETCAGQRELSVIREERLTDVDCSVERLSHALRARAAERGQRVLIEKRCEKRGDERFTLRCSASEALPAASAVPDRSVTRPRDPAPSPSEVRDLDEPAPQRSGRIRVSFSPERGVLPRAARAYHRVDETAQPSVGRQPMGQVSARCEDCDALALRHALRVTAGRVGAGEVAGVRCFHDDDDQRCVGTALEPWNY